MSPQERFAFVTKIREQAQKQFETVKTAADELLATLDDTQKAKARDTLPGLAALAPVPCAVPAWAGRSTGTKPVASRHRPAIATSPRTLRTLATSRGRSGNADIRNKCKKVMSMSNQEISQSAPSAPVVERRGGRPRDRWTALPGARLRCHTTIAPDPDLDRSARRRARHPHAAEEPPSVWFRCCGAVDGISSSYLGPVVRVRSGDTIPFRVENLLHEATTLHWHGLLIPSQADGGPHNMIAPGAVWTPELKVKQPAATTWFHPHPHGGTARQVYGGLAGMMIVSDGADRDRGLPETYGIDDLPIVLQDKRFGRNGELVYAPDHDGHHARVPGRYAASSMARSARSRMSPRASCGCVC